MSHGVSECVIIPAFPSSRHPGLDPGSRFSVRQQRADRQVNWLRYGSETPDQVRGDGEAAAENRTLQSNVQRVRMKIEHKERS